MLDVCVGTSVGTITEPDCLGPCEPGTSVTLEGIVWHETEGARRISAFLPLSLYLLFLVIRSASVAHLEVNVPSLG
ncbi:hypothetical protein J437_LFUL013523 [Ladona fulva]|uniref:Uncharacterized protein n=1 Tax=Ladona fulva TaxID=123851 RepID=A0A8K0P1V8_LADFU|nr:hypothetical protein J437_LFUL013523 [Ladona fulva]